MVRVRPNVKRFCCIFTTLRNLLNKFCCAEYDCPLWLVHFGELGGKSSSINLTPGLSLKLKLFIIGGQLLTIIQNEEGIGSLCLTQGTFRSEACKHFFPLSTWLPVKFLLSSVTYLRQ